MGLAVVGVVLGGVVWGGRARVEGGDVGTAQLSSSHHHAIFTIKVTVIVLISLSDSFILTPIGAVTVKVAAILIFHYLHCGNY